MKLTIVPTGNFIICTNCGAEIPISKNPKNNPLYCPDCNGALFIEADDNEHTPLNLHWAILTGCSAQVGHIFGIDRFQDKAQSERWKNFEKRHTYTEIIAAAETIHKAASGQVKGLGAGCFAKVIARVERGSQAPKSKPVEDRREGMEVGIKDVGRN